MSAFARMRSAPRVWGTTQNAQWSLHPSIIVTYALTGSDRRFVAGLLEEPGHALRIVHVHLTAERLNQVFLRHQRHPTVASSGFKLPRSCSRSGCEVCAAGRATNSTQTLASARPEKQNMR